LTAQPMHCLRSMLERCLFWTELRKVKAMLI
jgi:hypothetical protein